MAPSTTVASSSRSAGRVRASTDVSGPPRPRDRATAATDTGLSPETTFTVTPWASK
ncbi:Uncharacterised protein [Mycobacteroides abscessus]|nr:Uncharacterised protein [Mycobacteroides abscessus]